jgi:hypothetical protein
MSRYLKAIKKRSKNLSDRLRHVYQILFAPHKGALHRYNQESPHPQQMINLFENEWMSQFPPPFQHLKAGIYPLFEDLRLAWGIQQLGGVENKTVLELGPLEGGHSYMLQKQGAAAVVAVEANPSAYLRCLLVKQMMKLDRVDFLFGDFNEYLREDLSHFDVCIASGVLYHMKNPIELLALIAQKCSSLFLWTQYYDPLICKKLKLRSKFLKPSIVECQGFKHTIIPFQYGASRFWSTFIGGPARTSCWLSRQDILDGLRYFGFSDIQIHFEELDAPHGPCFSLVARKK